MGPPVYGLARKATRKERLRWDVYFTVPVADAERAALLEGLEHVTASWELDRILTLRWDGRGKVTTALFRDQVATRLGAWSEVRPIAGAHLCEDGPWRESLARARESAGLPGYPFPLLNHGQRPRRHHWRVTLLVATMPERETPGMEWFRKVGFAPLRAGAWLRLQHRYGMDPIPSAFARTIDEIDDALEALHAHVTIELGVFGPSSIAEDGDHRHAWSVARAASRERELPPDDAFEPLFAGAPPLDPAALAALMEEARESYEHADDQGDPESALEGLLEVAERLPEVHAAERRTINAWIRELSAIVAGG